MPAKSRNLREKHIVADKRGKATQRVPDVLPHQEPAVEPALGPARERWVGRPIVRKEESRLVRGFGKFIDDFKLPGMLYMRLVRSPYAHARITNVDVAAAEQHPGVICTLTGAEVAKLTTPFIEIGPEPSNRIQDFSMAVDRARYQGEPVAAVVALTRGAAEDAAELIQVDYEMLEPVIDAEFALTDKTELHQAMGTNKVWQGVFEYGDVEKAFREAASVVHIGRLHFHRFSSTPLENNAVIGQWDNKDDRVYFWTNNSF